MYSAERISGLQKHTVHDLRHDGISMWVRRGILPQDISRFAGHKSVSFTLERYYLASCDDEDIYNLFDSSALNEIVKAYMGLAVEELVSEGELDEDQGRAVRNRFSLLFDEKKAKEVL